MKCAGEGFHSYYPNSCYHVAGCVTVGNSMEERKEIMSLMVQENVDVYI